MKFKIDENLPVEIAEMLRLAGHDAMTVFDEQLVGEPDRHIIAVCLEEQRVLITLDMDFSDVREYPPESNTGLIVLRLRNQDKIHAIDAVSQLIPLFGTESPVGHLWIVEENRVRVRG